MLRPQDLLLVLRLSVSPSGAKLTFARLSAELKMSTSEVHAAGKRALASTLLYLDGNSTTLNKPNLAEFIIHGVKYAFPPRRGGLTRGVPTSLAAPPLARHFGASDLPPVWPHPEGKVRGEALEPLYPSAPDAALMNPALHEMLALTDAIRAGRARERELAVKEIKARLLG